MGNDGVTPVDGILLDTLRLQARGTIGVFDGLEIDGRIHIEDFLWKYHAALKADSEHQLDDVTEGHYIEAL